MADSGFGRALRATFIGTGNTLGAAIDFFVAPGAGESARTAGRLVGRVAGAAGDVGVLGTRGAGRGIRDRRRQSLEESIQRAIEAEDSAQLLMLGRELAQRYPSDPAGPAYQAMALISEGNYEEAVGATERAGRLGLPEREAHILRAEISAGAGDHVGAARELAHLIDDPEYSSYALAGRVHLLLEIGDVEQALHDANRAIAVSPDAAAYFSRARVHEAKGDFDACIADYTRAHKIDPDEVAILENRANAYEHAGMTEPASADRAAVRAATDFDPASDRMVDARELLAYLRHRGVQLRLAGNGRDLEIRGTELRSETRADVARLKPQLLTLLKSGEY